MNIKEYTLRNDKIEVSFINLGAAITKFIDLKTGINIIVGYNNIELYKENKGYMNSTIGRHAGRITDLKLDMKTYKLTKNVDDLYQLHGGFKGFNTKYFTVVERPNKIIFVTTSNNGEEGYPGDVIFWIIYEIVDDELHINYSATSNKKTLMSFTNHAYFNLNGNLNNTILDHELSINANSFLELDKNMVPKTLASLDNRPLDFRIMKKIGQNINSQDPQIKIAGGYDHPYLINKTDEINDIASLRSPYTGLVLDIKSNQDAVVFYSGNFINESYELSGGIKGRKHLALCLETQGIPNSVNIDLFKDRNIYEKDERYNQITIWKLHH